MCEFQSSCRDESPLARPESLLPDRVLTLDGTARILLYRDEDTARRAAGVTPECAKSLLEVKALFE